MKLYASRHLDQARSFRPSEATFRPTSVYRDSGSVRLVGLPEGRMFPLATGRRPRRLHWQCWRALGYNMFILLMSTDLISND